MLKIALPDSIVLGTAVTGSAVIADFAVAAHVAKSMDNISLAALVGFSAAIVKKKISATTARSSKA